MADENEDGIKLSIRRVAVIGAGASGLVAAKYLAAERCFDAVDVYEQRAEPGGIWNHTPQAAGDGLFHVPQTADVPGAAEQPLRIKGEGEESGDGGAVFLSPVYDGLEVNIPHPLMRFSDLAFPADLPLFPGHADVRRYLHRYADDVRHLIRFNTQVTALTPRSPSSGQESWTLTAKNLLTGGITHEIYDAVALAHGHYTTPYIPALPGLSDWHARYPGTVNHARYHRDPAREYRGAHTVIVGANVSGHDLARRLAPVCEAVFLAGAMGGEMPGEDPSDGVRNVEEDDGSDLSERYDEFWSRGFRPDEPFHDDINLLTGPGPLPHGVTAVPRLQSVNPADRSIECEGGRRIANVGHILFATGYLYTLPFLPPSLLSPSSPQRILRPGRGLGGLHHRLFVRARPSLALLAQDQRIVPFPIAEAQACLLARAWAGRVVMPPWEGVAGSVKKVGGTDADEEEEEERDRWAMVLGYPRDHEYMAFLLRWATRAAGGAGKRVPPGWGPRERWIRETLPAMRRAWVRRGARRFDVRSFEELGFVFEDGEGRNEGLE